MIWKDLFTTNKSLSLHSYVYDLTALLCTTTETLRSDFYLSTLKVFNRNGGPAKGLQVLRSDLMSLRRVFVFSESYPQYKELVIKNLKGSSDILFL